MLLKIYPLELDFHQALAQRFTVISEALYYDTVLRFQSIYPTKIFVSGKPTHYSTDRKTHCPSTGEPSSVAPFGASRTFTCGKRVDSLRTGAKPWILYDA